MSARKILFTDLADPLQRELLTRYRSESDARVFCLAGTEAEAIPVKLEQRSELGVDEVWHSATAGPLLKAIASSGVPVINYLASMGPGWEKLQAAALLYSPPPAPLAVDFDQEIEAKFVRFREESGLSYRIFKARNLIDACGNFPYPRANRLYNLLSEIVSFKQEIEDKSEGYFGRHSLRVDGTISVPLLSLTQAAESIFKIAADDKTLNGSYDIGGPAAVTLADVVGPLSESLGIKIEPESDRTTFNPIDLLLDDRLSIGRSVAHPAPNGLPKNDLIIRSFMSTYAERASTESVRVERARRALQPRMIEKENAEPLCYYTGGSGERTIVIINAYGQGLAYWTRVVADLVENFRVIIWLARGNRHDTVGVNKSSSVTDHREDLKELLTREQVHKAEFVGWCTGPKLILDYYDAYPDDVASMIFFGATFKDWPTQPQSDTEYEKSLAPLLTMVHQRPQLAARLIDSLRKVLLARNGDHPSLAAGDPHAHKEAMKMLGAPCSDLKQAVIEPLLSEASVISYSEQLLDFWHHDVTRLFESVRVPVLFVSGECDQIAHASMATAAVQMIPGAKRVEVRGGSHYLLYERSALTSGLIELFLQ